MIEESGPESVLQYEHVCSPSKGDFRRKPGEVCYVFEDYLIEVFKTAKGGDPTEPTYYPYLKAMLQTVAPLFGKSNIRVEQLPKRTEGGCPDFVVKEGNQHIVGYVEAKDVGADLTPNRMSKQNKDQFKRYLETFPNLIYTNFTEFRLYRDHDAKPLLTASLCEPPEDLGFKVPTDIDMDGKTKEVLERFFDFSLAKKYTAKTLAQELAKRTRFLKDEVAFEQKAEAAGGKKNVTKFFNAFKGTLIKNLKAEDFADLFSQTITFGLFAARYRTDGEFNRKLAYDSIPPTIGVLHDLFEYISRGKLPPLINQVVNDVAEVLAVADVHKILDDYYKEGKGKKDPIFYFYETFLREYNPKEKEQRGVFFTPEPVVGYIVQSVHKLLKSKFEKPEGLGYRSATDPKRSVMLLDPAGGTLTFLAEAGNVAINGYVAVHGDGDKDGFIRNHILENFYAFELMMAPYVLGHLKMSFLLDEQGYVLGDDERFKFYLTNTLTLDQDDIDEQMRMWEDVLPSFVAEADAASEVKKETPILVVIGNPPYSGHSANPSDELDEKGKPTGHMLLDIKKKEDGSYELYEPKKKTATSKRVPKKTFIGRLIEDYKIDEGKWLDEKNPKWLQDDYVKFMRFAQWKIDQKGVGILGFITNHAYIDNPTFRGMRQSLIHSFDEIYILDLHGNYKKKESCPDGSKDENVFDIQQGVAICLFVKSGDEEQCKVFHQELWGLREKKYDWLEEHNVETTEWTEISVVSPDSYFFPMDYTQDELYSTFWSVTDIFPIQSVGIATGKDRIAIAWTPEAIWDSVEELSKKDKEVIQNDLDISEALAKRIKEDLENSGPAKDKITRILYRPFDTRYTYYTGKSGSFIERPRSETMRHMIDGENLGLITSRMAKGEDFQHAQVTTSVIEVICLSSKTSNNGFLFPLYKFGRARPPDDPNQLSVLENIGLSKTPNIDTDLYERITAVYEVKPTPEDILHYIYAVLYSRTYREKFSEFLKRKFPRIPFTTNHQLFSSMAEQGKALVELHLLRSAGLDKPIAKFQGTGSNDIVKVIYKEAECRVYINDSKYFDEIRPDVWMYTIGGYQVLDKWLTERKKRGYLDSDLDEPKTFCRIATALARTIEIQKEIDKLYPEVEKAVIPPPSAPQTSS